MSKIFTVAKKGSGEILAIINTETGEIVETNGVVVLTEEEVNGYVEEP